ncbi:MAG: hypothetical protein IKO36_05405 [Bacteroidaceae bacterium]|nr:hypothetical protein [Bacteroidaceae bacterium]
MKVHYKCIIRLIFAVAILSIISLINANAQRKTDLLNRGLIAVKVQTGVYVS